MKYKVDASKVMALSVEGSDEEEEEEEVYVDKRGKRVISHEGKARGGRWEVGCEVFCAYDIMATR